MMLHFALLTAKQANCPSSDRTVSFFYLYDCYGLLFICNYIWCVKCYVIVQNGQVLDNLSTTEPVSPVVPKCLQKATVPPAKITQFFKQKQPSGQNTIVETSTVSTDSNQMNESVVCDIDLTSDSLSVRTVCSIGETPAAAAAGSCSSIGLARSSTKRACSKQRLPLAKISKQSSILSLLTNTDNKPKTMKCPICSKVFLSEVSNAEVNEHIDNCLIE